MKVDNFLIGSDIEVFITDRQSGKFISAAGDESSGFVPRIPGTKDEPYYIDDERTKAIETDNVSIEFLIPPTNNEDSFVESINFMLDYIRMTLPAYQDIATIASAEFDEDQLLTSQAQTFGCDKDFNAWSCKFNKRPNTNTNLRSNGFHIHIGYDNPSEQTSLELVKAMDLFVGLESLKVDNDTRRRELYGKAGSMRFKPYGVEYRVLSSFLISSEEYIRMVFKNTIKAINFVNNGKTITSDMEKQIITAINTNNIKLIEEICVEL